MLTPVVSSVIVLTSHTTSGARHIDGWDSFSCQVVVRMPPTRPFDEVIGKAYKQSSGGSPGESRPGGSREGEP